ncbi:MAG: DUF3095 domain-containing protein [Pseudomonadota bacterium]
MAPDQDTAQFFQSLSGFSDFSLVGDETVYQPLPDDWLLLISDVVESTKAIERGEYKAVNMVGAASIICVLNIAEDIELPYVFGGDGGLIAVPPVLADQAKTALSRLRNTSKTMFGLELRAAAIPVGDLRTSGAETLVGKLQLSPGNDLAMFAGNGVPVADAWLKSEGASAGYEIPKAPADTPPDLEGLSCRWEPLEARNGTMLTLIIVPNQGTAVSTFNTRMVELLGDAPEAHAPARDETMRFRFPPRGLTMEIAAGLGKSTPFKRAFHAHFTALMQLLCERFAIKIGDYDGAAYRKELQSNTDFRKYDGALRMVIDVTTEQADKIEKMLEAEYQSGTLTYGTFRSPRALMTCLLFSLDESRHIHFVDGADGGYALAAKGLKQRLAASSPAG